MRPPVATMVNMMYRSQNTGVFTISPQVKSRPDCETCDDGSQPQHREGTRGGVDHPCRADQDPGDRHEPRWAKAVHQIPFEGHQPRFEEHKEKEGNLDHCPGPVELVPDRIYKERPS